MAWEDDFKEQPSEYDNTKKRLSEDEFLHLRRRRKAERHGDPLPGWGHLGAYDGERYRQHGRRV